jgi:hypothetical protein
MKRPLASVLPALGLAAVLCLARSALAQITTDATTSAATPDIIVIPETHTKGISTATAARLNAAVPKFIPPAATAPGAPASAARLEDKPKNGIVRLPDYIINEPKAPAFKERELLTGYGHLQLAYKRHPGLHFGSLPILSNNGIAFFMLEEDYRLERKKEMEELSGLIMSPTARAHAKDETQAVFMRTSAP